MGAGFIPEMNQVLSLGELKSIDLRREFISMDQNLFHWNQISGKFAMHDQGPTF